MDKELMELITELMTAKLEAQRCKDLLNRIEKVIIEEEEEQFESDAKYARDEIRIHGSVDTKILRDILGTRPDYNLTKRVAELNEKRKEEANNESV